MSYKDYVKQLEQVNLALESCSDENKEELLSLKNSLDELLALTCENDENLTESEEVQIDDEYALFMAEINEVSQNVPNTSKNEDDDSEALCSLKEMEGKMCRAPHTNKWGSKGYHNAMICSVIPQCSTEQNSQVRVLFVNPTHEEMLPCPYYFDTDCKFSEDKCKYSHGEIVSASDLRDFIEPDFASLQMGSPVLAKQDNKLWGRAKITRILDDTCLVKFETVKKDMELPFKEILPMENDDCGPEEGSEDESGDCKIVIDQEVVNMSLMNTPSDGPLGDWEKFTKGIGSKLMQKMGYIVGTGLGKKSDGRIDPVTAVVLPPGKSLDHCMNLREKHGGDKNLFSVERKMKKLQRKQEIKNRKAYQKELKKKDVFKFLNNTLTNNPSSSSATYNRSKHRQDVKKETCKNLNVESFKTEENIKRTEKDINIIKESLTRHKDENSAMHKSLKQKLNSSLNQLSDLMNQAQNIKNEQDNRRDRKKLTVF